MGFVPIDHLCIQYETVLHAKFTRFLPRFSCQDSYQESYQDSYQDSEQNSCQDSLAKISKLISINGIEIDCFDSETITTIS